ncbi:MAG: hypothetical protein RM347_002110 [Nostoc sp. ChiQUE02]|nr:hypothetical protein [Nostoc sp. ChiQUE02]MDZ8230812.1 hypothetical protein [Nostoc sp. ChiQUE02]
MALSFLYSGYQDTPAIAFCLKEANCNRTESKGKKAIASIYTYWTGQEKG